MKLLRMSRISVIMFIESINQSIKIWQFIYKRYEYFMSHNLDQIKSTTQIV